MAPPPAPSNRSRRRARRPGMAARSASSQRWRSAAVGGGAKSAGSGRWVAAFTGPVSQDPSHWPLPYFLMLASCWALVLAKAVPFEPSRLARKYMYLSFVSGFRAASMDEIGGVQMGPGIRPLLVYVL